nr:helix-turn-helix transcriptional regulator [Streptomyces sp. NBC_00857]
MSSHAPNQARVTPLRPAAVAPASEAPTSEAPTLKAKEPLWRNVVGDVLRRERLAQERTLKDVAERARISMPYLSELERGRKEASSEVLAAAARALGLGLADLLALAQAELARLDTVRPGRPRTSAAPASITSIASRHDISTRRGGVRGTPPQGEVRLAA